jgi:hypothetical protein
VAIVLHKSPLGHGIPNIEKFSFENQTATFAKPLLAARALFSDLIGTANTILRQKKLLKVYSSKTFPSKSTFSP